MPRLVVAAFVLALAACAPPPPLFEPREYPPLDAVAEGATAQDVRKALGPPTAVRNGWWTSGYRYEEDFQVWYYAGQGRVVFDAFDGRVVLTEADPGQPKRPVSQPRNGLY